MSFTSRQSAWHCWRLCRLIWQPDPALFESGTLLWGGMVNYDPLSQIFKVMLLLGGAVTCLMAAGDKGVGDKGEFYLIVIVATLGGVMMSSASDLILVFVALETLSIPLYMLASFRRGDSALSRRRHEIFPVRRIRLRDHAFWLQPALRFRRRH